MAERPGFSYRGRSFVTIAFGRGSAGSGRASAFGLASRERLHIVGGQRIAANSPVPAFDLFDDNPGYTPHVLAFDGYHRVRELADHGVRAGVEPGVLHDDLFDAHAPKFLTHRLEKLEALVERFNRGGCERWEAAEPEAPYRNILVPRWWTEALETTG